MALHDFLSISHSIFNEGIDHFKPLVLSCQLHPKFKWIIEHLQKFTNKNISKISKKQKQKENMRETECSIFRIKLLMIFTFVMIFPTLKANIGEFDEVWQERSKEAKKAAFDAFQPDPEEVANNLNKEVNSALYGGNKTRRNLGKYNGPCLATNPIDRCWRCDKNWYKNRKKLADCALGFGRGTIGGKNGEFYVVRDSSDHDMLNPKPGTLRHAVIQDRPLWITFASDMVIRLVEELIFTDNKTIDGRGANVHIAHGGQMTLQFVKNIIIHNVHVHDIKAGNGGLIRDSVSHYGFRTRSDGDGISLFGASKVWIDHVSLYHCTDGLIDAIMASTGITISNCHFTHHNDVLLLGASDGYSDDRIMQVTLAFNHFGKGLVQRMPRCRWGFFHVVNNDFTHWRMYAIGGSSNPTIISQGNRFTAPPNPNCKEVTKRVFAPKSVWKSWNWRSEGDLKVNGAFFVQSGNPVRGHSKKDVISAKPGTYVTRLTRFCGTLHCRRNQPC